MTKQMKADIMLLVVTLGWGISYILMDFSLKAVGPFMLNAYRFLIAFFVAAVLLFPRLRGVSRTTLRYSALIGVALTLVYTGCTVGVMYTSLSNAGFLCALTVVITPVFSFLFLRQRPEKKLILVVAVALIGIALLTLTESLTPKLGDVLCIMAATAYAGDLLLTERAVKQEEVNALQLGIFQLGFTGLFMLILSIFFGELTVPSSGSIWGAVLALSIMCTGIAFIVQTVAQQYTSASHVGVIFALEPVFAGVAAFFVAGEVLTPRAYLGAFLLVSCLFIMELDLNKIFARLAGVKKKEALPEESRE